MKTFKLLSEKVTRINEIQIIDEEQKPTFSRSYFKKDAINVALDVLAMKRI